jgi:hypothetical protein
VDAHHPSMSLQDKLDQEYEANRSSRMTPDVELLALRAMKHRLEEWAVQLDATQRTSMATSDIAMELRNRMAGKVT